MFQKPIADPLKLDPSDLDLNEIIPLSDSTKYEIPHFFDQQEWKVGQTYRVRVPFIHHFLKFYIVTKEKELEIFLNYMTQVMERYKDRLKIPVKDLKQNMYCIAKCDSCYYRVILLYINPPNTEHLVANAFLYDYGSLYRISVDDLYYMPKSFFTVPRFAIRAKLSCMAPNTVEKDWSLEGVYRFSTLTQNKVLLAYVTHINTKLKTLSVVLHEYDTYSRDIIDINRRLVNEDHSTTVTVINLTDKLYCDNGNYKCNMKLPFTFPTFESLEYGEVPDSHYATLLLKEFNALDHLFENLYVYKEHGS